MNENIDGFDKLQEIGSQKIHEDTHIPKEHTRGLVAADFSNMNKIQFVGFVSIIEREYGINLDTLKDKGLAYFKENIKDFTIAKKVFIVPKKKKSFTKFYLLAIFAVFAFVIFSNLTPSLKTQGIEMSLDDTNIHNATKSIAPKLEQVIEKEEAKKEAKRLSASFKILPKANLWVGYINLDTGEKLQTTFEDELVLNPHGHWLLTLGHGNVDFEVNGELSQFKTSRNLRFEYKDSKLRKIKVAEFTRLNKGEKW